MDFPLVSIAMSYDGANPLDMAKLIPLIEQLPLFATVYHVLEELDSRDPKTWKAKGPNEVLMRNGTSTRADYEGHGLMREMAHWLIRETAAKGFRGIQIECAHDAVHKTWMNPPAGSFKATLISKLDSKTYEEEVDGKLIKPFAPSEQVSSKIYVSL